MPWRYALVAPALVVLAGLAFFLPYLTEDRAVLVATPQPPPRFEVAPIELQPGAETCARPVPVEEAADLLQVRAFHIQGVAPSPLEVSVRSGSYAAQRTFRSYADFQALQVPLPDPPQPVEAEVCIENVGARPALVEGSGRERERGRLETTVAGEPSDRDLVVLLRAERRESVLDRLGAVGDRAATLQPGFIPEALLWVVALLVLAGVPLGVAVALRRGDQA